MDILTFKSFNMCKLCTIIYVGYIIYYIYSSFLSQRSWKAREIVIDLRYILQFYARLHIYVWTWKNESFWLVQGICPFYTIDHCLLYNFVFSVNHFLIHYVTGLHLGTCSTIITLWQWQDDIYPGKWIVITQDATISWMIEGLSWM